MPFQPGFTRSTEGRAKYEATLLARARIRLQAFTNSGGTIDLSTLRFKQFGQSRFMVVNMACNHCGRVKEYRTYRLMETRRGFTGACRKCLCRIMSGPRHPQWNGGRYVNPKGYVILYLDPADPLYCMAMKSGRIHEHRLVMARHIGRPLKRSEHVHHKNRNKQDNRLSNLALINGTVHYLITQLEHRIDNLEAFIQAHGLTSPAW